ncbi:DUF6089 family protein [Crocinitomix algicola]|uniref:DUF6089 family protein n=1 Tax=Crocinitomix algicola TaxID=1740263 RepID=UPI00082AC933|nr:DUF6089 family protein [Crocinitomix algicola]
MKKIFLILCVIVASNGLFAQQYNLGFGARAGVSNFLGDIGSGDLARNFVYNMELRDTRWAFGTFTRYRFHPLFAVQGSFDWVRIQGEDSNSDNSARRGRNLQFQNDLLHLSAKLEYYPQVLTVSDVGYRGRYRLDYQTYFFAGVGGVYHNPKAEYNGSKVKLRQLMTEGVSYSPVAVTMPFGAGFFFTYDRVHRFGLEMGWNWTFTDYLDDISTVYVDPSQMSDDPLAPALANRYIGVGNVPDAVQYGPDSPRGDPTDRDNFMTISVSYSYLIRTKGSFYRRNYSWLWGKRKRWGGTKAKF